jgi:PAS domain S-box-containing protein
MSSGEKKRQRPGSDSATVPGNYRADGEVRDPGLVAPLGEGEFPDDTLTHMMSNLSEGLWAWDVSQRRIYVSHRWREILGYDADEIDGTPEAIVELIHPDDRPEAYRVGQPVLDGRADQDRYDLEQRFRHRQGHWVWLLTRSSVVERDAAGRAVRVVGTITDITERKQAQQRLAHSEATYRMLAETTADCIWHLRPDYTYSYISDSIQPLLGYAPEEFCQTRMPDHLSAEDLERVEGILSQLLARRDTSPVTIEAHLKHKTGHWVPVEIRGRLILGDQGEVEGIQGTTRDIRDRKRAQEELLRRQGDLLSAQRLARLGSWSLEVDTGRLNWSDEMYRIFGWPRSRPTPTPEEHREFIHADDWDCCLAALDRALSTGEGYYVEYRIVLPDGTVRYLATRGETERSAGRVVRVYGATQDITERKATEQERRHLDARMQHAQKLESLGVLAGGIAHDFNNLLMSVMGNADLALLELAPSSAARESVEEIKRTAARAADLCRQMLAYSGRGKTIVEAVDLSEVVEEMSHMLDVSISKRAVLNKNLARPLPAVCADVTQLRQVVMNLITNASEALGEADGAICVSTGASECARSQLADAYVADEFADGLHVFIEVTDTGCGMDGETQARIFDPFYTTKFTGRGLGLAAVLGIIRGHKGAIRVESTPGKGTSIRVLLPATRQPVADVLPGPSVPDRASLSGTVLLADDEETVRAVSSRMLRRMGLEVMTASDGQEAVELFARHRKRIDGVLLDLTMPQMDGVQAFEQLRRIDPEVRVLLASGYSEQDVAQRFPIDALRGIVHKPFDFETLRSQLQHLLGE